MELYLKNCSVNKIVRAFLMGAISGTKISINS